MPTPVPRRHVLLIDDQNIVARAAQALIDSQGAGAEFVLSHAPSAREGVASAGAEAPDVVLLDLTMPDRNGLDVLRELRSMVMMADVPIVVLSATADSAVKERAFQLGANDYLVKFPDAVEFVARLRLHTRGGRTAASRAAELSRCADALAQAQDLAEVEELTLTTARHLTDADAGGLWLIEPLPAVGESLTERSRLRLVCSQSDLIQGRLGPGARLPLEDVVLQATPDSIIGHVVRTNETLRIDDVASISPDLPYRFSGRFSQQIDYPTVSVLVAPLHDGIGRIIGALQLVNARGGAGPGGAFVPFTPGDESAFEVFTGLTAIAMERARLIRASILRLVAATEMRDPMETGSHVQRVAECSVAIHDRWAAKHGISLEETARQRDRLRLAAMLHDVGKIAIPDEILKKPGPLSHAERDRMETHTTCGARLFSGSVGAHDLASREVALHHHERWDGAGYPGNLADALLDSLPREFLKNPDADTLSGAAIPLFARIVAIADVYDALTSQRAYKQAWSRAAVEELLRTEAGRHFDPELVPIALKLIPYFESVRLRHPESAG
ncbi:MAG: response regulator [Planctomycetota bacterium]|nr:response regulator [Planctomycetota bacterium]MDA1106129.1 response regulator [Planctomycetota bacterium]